MSKTLAIHLVDMIFDYLSFIDNNCLSTFLANWPSKPFYTRTISRNPLPVLSYLPEINFNKNDKFAEIINTLKDCAKHFWWGQTYTSKDFGEAFLKNYGWTELIGLRGPVVSNDIACGFLLLGPNIEYPKHSHEAEEVYVPSNSKALWIQGEEGWMSKQSGLPIYHEPWIPHGIRTSPTPLLALYIWHGGNLVQKSQIEQQRMPRKQIGQPGFLIPPKGKVRKSDQV